MFILFYHATCQQDKTRDFHWPLGTLLLARSGLNIKWYHYITQFVYENELRLNPGSFYPYGEKLWPVCMAILSTGSYAFLPPTKNKKTEQISQTL